MTLFNGKEIIQQIQQILPNFFDIELNKYNKEIFREPEIMKNNKGLVQCITIENLNGAEAFHYNLEGMQIENFEELAEVLRHKVIPINPKHYFADKGLKIEKGKFFKSWSRQEWAIISPDETDSFTCFTEVGSNRLPETANELQEKIYKSDFAKIAQKAIKNAYHDQKYIQVIYNFEMGEIESRDPDEGEGAAEIVLMNIDLFGNIRDDLKDWWENLESFIDQNSHWIPTTSPLTEYLDLVPKEALVELMDAMEARAILKEEIKVKEIFTDRYPYDPDDHKEELTEWLKKEKWIIPFNDSLADYNHSLKNETIREIIKGAGGVIEPEDSITIKDLFKTHCSDNSGSYYPDDHKEELIEMIEMLDSESFKKARQEWYHCNISEYLDVWVDYRDIKKQIKEIYAETF